MDTKSRKNLCIIETMSLHELKRTLYRFERETGQKEINIRRFLNFISAGGKSTRHIWYPKTENKWYPKKKAYSKWVQVQFYNKNNDIQTEIILVPNDTPTVLIDKINNMGIFNSQRNLEKYLQTIIAVEKEYPRGTARDHIPSPDPKLFNSKGTHTKYAISTSNVTSLDTMEAIYNHLYRDFPIVDGVVDGANFQYLPNSQLQNLFQPSNTRTPRIFIIVCKARTECDKLVSICRKMNLKVVSVIVKDPTHTQEFGNTTKFDTHQRKILDDCLCLYLSMKYKTVLFSNDKRIYKDIERLRRENVYFKIPVTSVEVYYNQDTKRNRTFQIALTASELATFPSATTITVKGSRDSMYEITWP